MRFLENCIWILIVLSLCLSAGCKQKSNEEGKVLLRWSAYGHQAYDKFRYEYSAKFEKTHPEVKIRYEPIDGLYQPKLMTQIAGGTAPDIFFIPGPFPPDFVNRGLLLDMTNYVEKDKGFFSEIYEPLMEAQRYKRKIWALPNNANIAVLFYNRKFFDEAGIAYPDVNWNWSDLLSAAKRLTKKDETGKITRFGLTMPSGAVIWNFVFQNNGYIWNEDKTKCVVNNSQTKNAFQFYSDLIHKEHVSPTQGEEGTMGFNVFFLTGLCAMQIDGRWFTTLLKDKSRDNLDWAIAPLPKGKKRITELSFNSIGILASTKHPELAFEFLKFLVSEDSIGFLIGVGDSIPIRWRGKSVDYFLNEPGSIPGQNQIYLDGMKSTWNTVNDVYSPLASQGEQYSIMVDAISKTQLNFEPVENILVKMEERLNNLITDKNSN